LLRHLANNAAGIGVENTIAVYVPDAAHGIAYLFSEIEPGVAGDLARQHYQIAFGQRFAGYSTQWVLFETGVENVIANRVADLIGVAFSNGLGGKNVTARHGGKRNSLKR
jgi:hypothetical protein